MIKKNVYKKYWSTDSLIAFYHNTEKMAWMYLQSIVGILYKSYSILLPFYWNGNKIILWFMSEMEHTSTTDKV